MLREKKTGTYIRKAIWHLGNWILGGYFVLFQRGDCVKILNGRYMVRGTEKIVHLSEMNKQKYKKRFKGKLYCPTEGCPALLSYSGGIKPHFRTWRRRRHSEGCMYNVYRNRIENEGGNLGDKTLTISGHRRQNALRDAARLFTKSEDERKTVRETTSPEKGKGQRAKRSRKEHVQMTLYDGDLLEDDTLVKGKAIRKKFVNEINQKDIGQVRLVLGYIQRALLNGAVADIHIEHNGAILPVVFPEEFVKERLNSSYLNKFASLLSAIEAGQVLTFMGVGDIRMNENGVTELAIYSGGDFKINNLDLSVFAKQWNDKGGIKG